jgi:hypothetical protein
VLNASALPTARPTRRPAATVVIQASRKPRPSALPIRSRAPAPTSLVALESSLRFFNANPTVVNKTETLQRFVTNIACALRLPFERIQIKNITHRMRNATRILPFDPALVSLSSNGEVVCFVEEAMNGAMNGTMNGTMNGAMNGAANATGSMGRRLADGDASVDINYIIVEPPLEILTMNPAEFSMTLSSEPAIAALATTLGSTGISAEAPAELALSGGGGETAPPPANGSSSSGIGIPVLVGGILGGLFIGAVIVMGAVVLVSRRNARRERSQPYPKQSPAVVVFQSEISQRTENPLMRVASRSAFFPHTVRTGTQV